MSLSRQVLMPLDRLQEMDVKAQVHSDKLPKPPTQPAFLIFSNRHAPLTAKLLYLLLESLRL